MRVWVRIMVRVGVRVWVRIRVSTLTRLEQTLDRLINLEGITRFSIA